MFFSGCNEILKLLQLVGINKLIGGYLLLVNWLLDIYCV